MAKHPNCDHMAIGEVGGNFEDKWQATFSEALITSNCSLIKDYLYRQMDWNSRGVSKAKMN